MSPKDRPPKSPEAAPGHTPRDTHYANLRRAFRDAKQGDATGGPAKDRPGGKGKPAQGKPAWSSPPPPPDRVHLYGLHTVRAALDNPERTIERMLVTKNALARLEIADPETFGFPIEIVAPGQIDKELGPDAVHQGVMIVAKALPMRRLEDLKDRPLLLVLDQVTDPHNVGAIMRTAVGFEAGAVITTMRHSPHESGVMAKSASGALELIPYIQITNLADALAELHALGFTTIGLDSEADTTIEAAFAGDRIALVLGAEGKGLRQKTRATVTTLARLNMPGRIKSLNVSNATAIALYAANRHLDKD